MGGGSRGRGGGAQDSLPREAASPHLSASHPPCLPWALPYPLGSPNTVGRLRQAGGVLDTQREGGAQVPPAQAAESERAAQDGGRSAAQHAAGIHLVSCSRQRGARLLCSGQNPTLS